MDRKCKLCQTPFVIEADDLEFLKTVSPTFDGKQFEIPPPTLCPSCRAQRRYMWRGELHLFRRTRKDGTGAPFLTFYPPNSPVGVLPAEDWWGDSWNPLDYGRDFDFSRSFFDQFLELLNSVPLLALSTQRNSDNCEYTNCASWNKNCYLIAGANYDEDCYYGNYVNHSKSCIDNSFIRNCELCYECVDCTGCYDVRYSSNSHNCSSSQFLANCRNCQECFGSVNLVGKRHCFFNDQLTPAAYKEKLAGLELHKRSSVERVRTQFEKHRLNFPVRFMIGEMNENVSGNSVFNSRSTHSCFDVSELWDCKHCAWFHKGKNCRDIVAWGFPAELCYECTEAGDNAYHALFSVSAYGAQEVLYCYYSMYSHHCFGSVSLRKEEYCILNKKFSKETYEKQVAKIIRHMQETGEWGEFFPIRVSPLSYNTAIAQDYFPVEKTTAEQLGARWYEDPSVAPKAGAPAVPDSVRDLSEANAEGVFNCRISGKPFKFVRQEVEFYRRNDIPPPDVSFLERHRLRLARRNPRQLWDRKCAECSAAIVTSYAPFRPEKVLCEPCYLKACY